MSDEFDEIALNEFMHEMSDMVEHMVLLKGELNRATLAGDVEAAQEAGMELTTAISHLTVGALPMALMSLIERILTEQRSTLNVLELVHAEKLKLREITLNLSDNPSGSALMALLDVAQALDGAESLTPYSRMGDAVE